jgi:hypothetical protein
MSLQCVYVYLRTLKLTLHFIQSFLCPHKNQWKALFSALPAYRILLYQADKKSTPFFPSEKDPQGQKCTRRRCFRLSGQVPTLFLGSGCRGISSNKFQTPIFKTPGNNATACMLHEYVCVSQREREREREDD